MRQQRQAPVLRRAGGGARLVASCVRLYDSRLALQIGSLLTDLMLLS